MSNKLQYLRRSVGVLVVVAAGAGCELLREPGFGNEQARDGRGAHVRGEIEEIYASGDFRFDVEEGLINTDSILVVLGPDVEAPNEATEATVEGEVQELRDVADFEARYGFPFSSIEDEVERETFIIASRVDEGHAPKSY